ncbi:M20 family metallopeptidase [Gudongella sp. DL1XJH-153]|uniref:M20 family metallopeptidase n=1 Tax=Gudongella sp. DL1XJH-153 TaxID=3409804 RepID=UPI003BB6665F
MMQSVIDKEKLEKLLAELISIYSPYLKEEEVMEYVLKWFKVRDIPAEYHRYSEDRILKYNGINVVGRLKGDSDGPRILLNGHVDTVEKTEDWSTDPTEPIRDGDKLYGLGALDMKSGVAAIMMAVEAFKRNHSSFAGEIVYTIVSDEEGPYGLGTDALILDGITDDIDAAIVPEPSSGFVGKPFPVLCLGARGGWNYSVFLKGKAAHAANPEMGLSAIVEASKLILELKNTELIQDEKLGKGDICIIGMNGGGAACSVAEKAVFTVFRHVVRGESREYLVQEVMDAAERAGIQAEIQVKFRDSPHSLNGGFDPYIVEEDNQYTKLLMESINEVTGTRVDIQYFSSIGDFNYLGTRAGIPTFVFGPSGENYHTADEYVNLNSVVETSEVIYKFLEKNLIK